MKTKLARKLMSVFFTLCLIISVVPIPTFAEGVNYMPKVNVAYTNIDYKAGDTPQATASVTEGNCTIAYEYWRELHQEQEGSVWSGTGRYWYSDSEKMNSLSADKRITQFEAGHHYSYNIVLAANNGYFFGEDKTVVSVGEHEWGTPGNHTNLAIKEMNMELNIYGIYAVDLPDESQPGTIASAAIENVKFYYQPGDAPQATAKRTGVNQDKYDILYECWQKREKDANDTVTTVGYWYSDENCYSNNDSRFSTFEKGGRYKYSVKLEAKDGYTFDSNLNNQNVTLNGASLPFGTFVNVMDEGKTCLINYGTEIRPGQAIEEIRLDGAVINFNAGDKPSFSGGVVSPYIEIDHQRWDSNQDSGYGITSRDYWNERYNGKLITEFESGKSYTYGVYFKISDLGIEEGYCFDKNTKLYINGQEITLTPEQISLDDSGETIWFYNVLTMTPEAPGTISNHNYRVIEGANSSWANEVNEALTFRIDGDFSKFVGIKIDGEWVDKENYTADSGSTIVTLKNEYLKTLPIGQHKITFVYKDGEVNTNFEIKREGIFENPKTGDNINIFVWASLVASSALAVLGISVYNKKKKSTV